MTLKEFKSMAQRDGATYDNSEEAAKEWGRTWGMSWWRSLWRYKEYTYGGYTYRTGKVYTRHTNYSYTEYCMGRTEITKKNFMEAIRNMEYKEPEQPAIHTTRQNQYVQLNFAF